MSKVLIAIAQGSEEVEVSSPFDALVRAGSKVTLAKAPINADDAKDLQVTFNNGMKVVADEKIDDAAKKDWDLIVVPGGIPGTENLAKCTVLIDMLKKQKAAGKWISAICAAPAYVLTPNGLLAGEKATGYPSTQGMLPDKSAAKEEVVVSNKVITSQSPGTALKFGFELVKALYGEEKLKDVMNQAYPKA